MRVISVSALREYWDKNPEVKGMLQAWHRHILKADWADPNEVKNDFRHASILKDGRVVFNILGNKYRLIVRINYIKRIVYIRFIGNHIEYDLVDAQKV